MPEPATMLTLETREPAREQIKTAEPAYLTALQVAELLQLGEKTVLRWSLQDPSMPVLRRGRVVRFPREPPARLARAAGAAFRAAVSAGAAQIAGRVAQANDLAATCT